jgi:hypothetical protein
LHLTAAASRFSEFNVSPAAAAGELVRSATEGIPVTAIRYVGLALIAASVLAWASSSPAYISMPKEPIAHKVAAADCVVLGKITAIRDKPEQGQVYRYSATPRWDFTIVEVDVTESLYGAKDKKKLRFGFRNIGWYKQESKPGPAVGKTGYFCGVQVGKNDFYIVPLDCFCEEKGPGFEKDLPAARRLGRLLVDPEKGLKSAGAEDRLLTAYLLVLRSCYVPWRHGETGKTQPIDAEQSKRILLALAEGDWKKNSQEIGDAVAALQLSVKFGAPAMKDFPIQQGEEQGAAATKQWLKENAETYRIHRLLKADKTGPASK